MHMTNFDHLSIIVGTYQPRGPRAALVSDIPAGRSTRPAGALRMRRLHDYEVIRSGDVVEDVQAGDRAQVRRGGFYEAVIGYSVGEAKKLPAVHDILRPVQ